MADCFGLRFARCRRFPAGLCEDWRYRADAHAHAFRLSADGYRCRWARVRLRAVACADPSPR